MEVAIDHQGDRPAGGALLDGHELAAREAAWKKRATTGRNPRYESTQAAEPVFAQPAADLAPR